MKRVLVRCLSVVFVSLSLSACASVEPWERGDLARKQMALDPNPARSAERAHTFAAREAASGSDTAVGGGCGCN